MFKKNDLIGNILTGMSKNQGWKMASKKPSFLSF